MTGRPVLEPSADFTNGSACLDVNSHRSPLSGESAKAIFGALGTLAGGIAELRNVHGTGHGQTHGNDKIGLRQARLAVGAAATICIYLATSI